MRELNNIERDLVSGGTIKVDGKGNVISSKGTTSVGTDGSMTISTDDGWTFYASKGSWFILDNQGNEYDNDVRHFSRYMDWYLGN
ncbi:MAG: hypothetical protein V4631_18665 [Pseudomonadota bacterium]